MSIRTEWPRRLELLNICTPIYCTVLVKKVKFFVTGMHEVLNSEYLFPLLLGSYTRYSVNCRCKRSLRYKYKRSSLIHSPYIEQCISELNGQEDLSY